MAQKLLSTQNIGLPSGNYWEPAIARTLAKTDCALRKRWSLQWADSAGRRRVKPFWFGS